ncbi:uncharacterized protein LOC141607477 [Silene latifolia]|uniref:uncharacterized protein LOC141607477 n=1 Tax=Silene latifolia TaxID=37657 RepID=UPI003D785268
MSRWTLMLAEFDIKYVPLKAVKGRAVVDFLADNPMEEDSFTDMWYFPNENVVHVKDEVWDIYFDGASSSMGYGVGILLISPKENMYVYPSSYISSPPTMLLIINQVTGSWKIKSNSLAPYQAKIEELEKYFEEIHFVHLPREENQFSDALSKLTALVNIPDHIDSMPLCVERRSAPSYINEINGTEEDEIEPWYTSILKFKDTGEYPDNLDARGKRALQMLSTQFVDANGGQLYKKTAQCVLLRCIDQKTADKVMEEVHDRKCGPHMNAHILTRKIMRLGYYWTIMEADCRHYVRHCHNCQIFANVQHIPPSMLYTMTSPWPFSTLGIDIVGKVNPSGSGGHYFILVAIEYFIKWVEAKPYKVQKAKEVAQFIQN